MYDVNTQQKLEAITVFLDVFSTQKSHLGKFLVVFFMIIIFWQPWSGTLLVWNELEVADEKRPILSSIHATSDGFSNVLRFVLHSAKVQATHHSCNNCVLIVFHDGLVIYLIPKPQQNVCTRSPQTEYYPT